MISTVDAIEKHGQGGPWPHHRRTLADCDRLANVSHTDSAAANHRAKAAAD
jgi:hypothetical protein